MLSHFHTWIKWFLQGVDAIKRGQARNYWVAEGQSPLKNYPPLEKCVGPCIKLLDIVWKFWAPLRKLFSPPTPWCPKLVTGLSVVDAITSYPVSGKQLSAASPPTKETRKVRFVSDPEIEKSVSKNWPSLRGPVGFWKKM